MPLNIPSDLSVRFERWGLTLGRLRMEELEILREHRNDPAIAQYMIFRDHITAEQQAAWFASVDNRDNLYGTVYLGRELIGLTHLKNIDYETCSAEGGMTIWTPEHQNSLVPFRAALMGTDLAFLEYGFQRITCRVLAGNHRALRFNRALGYRFDDPPDAGGVVYGWLSDTNYWAATKMLREQLDQQVTA